MSIGKALPERMKEIREVYIPAYQEIGHSGQIAISCMQADLTRAEKAMMEGDTIEMINVYNDLMEYSL